MKKFIRRLLCSVGIHQFGKPVENTLRSNGEYRGLEELVYQCGEMSCLRDECVHVKLVWRSGWTGGDVMRLGSWKKMTPAMNTQISSLKERQLMA